MRHIIPISGKDSLATAIIQHKINPDLDYELMFNPTGEEPPIIFDWLKKVEEYFGKKIVHVGESLRDIVEFEMNWFLPSRNARYCTRMCKIEPMEKHIGDDLCTVYYGIRFDENRGGYVSKNGKNNITPAYPLKDSRITIDGVYEVIKSVDLKPPTYFWNWLYDRVCSVISKDLIASMFSEWQIDVIFAGRSRTNCSNCFNQRLYEWVWLLETYPDMFWNYESWEHNVSEYFFAGKGRSLKWIAEKAERIKENRAKKLIREILKKSQLKINFTFEDEEDFDDDFIDVLSVTSCGLLCGK